MALESYTRNLFGSKMLGDLSLVLIVADIGASGVATLSASESSPDVTIASTGAGNGQYNLTFPKCQTVFPFRPVVTLAEGVGSDAYFETCLAAGTATIETAVNTAAATAADPASGARIYIALLCGAN